MLYLPSAAAQIGSRPTVLPVLGNSLSELQTLLRDYFAEAAAGGMLRGSDGRPSPEAVQALVGTMTVQCAGSLADCVEACACAAQAARRALMRRGSTALELLGVLR